MPRLAGLLRPGQSGVRPSLRAHPGEFRMRRDDDSGSDEPTNMTPDEMTDFEENVVQGEDAPGRVEPAPSSPPPAD